MIGWMQKVRERKNLVNVGLSSWKNDGDTNRNKTNLGTFLWID